MKKLAVIVLILAAGCASSRNGDDDAALPPPSVSPQQQANLERQIAGLQTSLTELLDRLDVLNERMNRVEAGAVAPAQAVAPAPPQVRPEPATVTAAPAVRPAPSAIPRAVAGAQIADTYRGALMLYGAGKMDEARRTFQQAFDADPSGDLADNALYWIGETYFAAGNYTEAMRYYRRVMTEYSEQNKAPDALFKIALALEKTSDLALARSTLEEVIRKYPYSTASASAKLELKRIKY